METGICARIDRSQKKRRLPLYCLIVQIILQRENPRKKMNQSLPYLELGHIAYFSMDVAIDSQIPTYSGGLGILAGDMLRSAADLGIPIIGVTLLHRKGYFQQRLDSQGNQIESHSEWSPENYLKPLSPRITISIEGREVRV